MDLSEYKKYTVQAKKWIKGEAFFESLICVYAIPHHVVSPKDLGIDYFCEWVYGDRPTGVLFAVQVKPSGNERYTPQYKGIEKGRNELSKYEIHNQNLKIDESAFHYWRGLGIPIYLFVVIQDFSDVGRETLDCYYKRFTEILTNEEKRDEYKYYDDFYKVNDGSSFVAFKDAGELDGGFARDLFIDHVHLSYSKGNITYLDPREMGLKKFKSNGVFVDMLKIYKDKIIPTFYKTKQNLEYLGYIKTTDIELPRSVNFPQSSAQ